ncbi:unnamed protein product [Schistosoma curassoni]|uniref:Reverse transcriptase domain-containing protein n=1 Tax=Schistosoma curassoni TaxID=6186 RepID=A0A183JMF8_9TREM|nr:unnamed protein product [Schistosoma curassoni]
MMTYLSDVNHGIQWITFMHLDDSEFTGDLVLLSHTHQQMQMKTTSVVAASAAVGLNIHKGKGDILECSTGNTNPVSLDKETREEVETVTYLDSVIDERGESGADVKVRIDKARAAFRKLNNI